MGIPNWRFQARRKLCHGYPRIRERFPVPRSQLRLDTGPGIRIQVTDHIPGNRPPADRKCLGSTWRQRRDTDPSFSRIWLLAFHLSSPDPIARAVLGASYTFDSREIPCRRSPPIMIGLGCFRDVMLRQAAAQSVPPRGQPSCPHGAACVPKKSDTPWRWNA